LSKDPADDFRKALEEEDEMQRVENFLVGVQILRQKFEPAKLSPRREAALALFDERLMSCLDRFDQCLEDGLPMTNGDAYIAQLLVAMDDLEWLKGGRRSREYNGFVNRLVVREIFLLFPPPGNNERGRVEKFLLMVKSLRQKFNPAKLSPLREAFLARFDQRLKDCLPTTIGDACLKEILILIDGLEDQKGGRQNSEYNRFVTRLVIAQIILLSPLPRNAD
jgi:hypothetical protein